MTSGEPNGVGDLNSKRGSWLIRANTVERQETPNRSRCIIFEHSKIWRNTLAVKSQHGAKSWRKENGKNRWSASPATETRTNGKQRNHHETRAQPRRGTKTQHTRNR